MRAVMAVTVTPSTSHRPDLRSEVEHDFNALATAPIAYSLRSRGLAQLCRNCSWTANQVWRGVVSTAGWHASRLSPILLRVLGITWACQRFSGAANPAALRITAAVRSMPASELIIKL